MGSRTPASWTPDQPIPSPKREAFARDVAIRGRLASAAYAANYDSEKAKQDKNYASSEGSKLARQKDVAARIEYLKEQKLEREFKEQERDRDFVTSQLWKEYENADKPSDRIAALKLLGTEQGMFIQRREVLTANIDPFTEAPDVLRERIAGLVARLFPGADPDALLRAHASGRALPVAGEVVEAESPRLQPVPEASRVPRAGEDEAEAVPDGREPGGEDVLRRDGDGVPSDRPVSELVDG